MPAHTYDSKCHDLADAFLRDHPEIATHANTDELAAIIQSTIDEYVAEKRSNYEPPDPMAHVDFPFARNH